jgi:hypothetical protein
MITFFIIKTAATEGTLNLAREKMSISVKITLSFQVYGNYKYPAMVFRLQCVDYNGKK